MNFGEILKILGTGMQGMNGGQGYGGPAMGGGGGGMSQFGSGLGALLGKFAGHNQQPDPMQQQSALDGSQTNPSLAPIPVSGQPNPLDALSKFSNPSAGYGQQNDFGSFLRKFLGQLQ